MKKGDIFYRANLVSLRRGELQVTEFEVVYVGRDGKSIKCVDTSTLKEGEKASSHSGIWQDTHHIRNEMKSDHYGYGSTPEAAVAVLGKRALQQVQNYQDYIARRLEDYHYIQGRLNEILAANEEERQEELGAE